MANQPSSDRHRLISALIPSISIQPSAPSLKPILNHLAAPLPWFLLLTFYGFTLSGPFSLGKLVITALVGLWLVLAPTPLPLRVSPWPAAYLAAITLTTLTSSDLWVSVFSLYGTYQAGLLAAVCLIPYWACVTTSQRSGIEQGIRWGTALTGILAVAQYAGIAGATPFPLPLHRVYSTLGSPVYLGAAIALCFPFAKTPTEKVLALATLWMTGSRGAWMAVAAGAVYTRWPTISARVRVWGLTAISAGLVAAMYLRPPSDLGRVVTWAAAVDAFHLRPLVGWGAGNFLMVAALWRNPAWVEVYGVTTQDHAHNLFLEAASTSGIVGLSTLCGLLWTMWIRSDRVARSSLLGVFIVGLLNPLPLVVKALCLALVASSPSHLQPAIRSSPVISRIVKIYFILAFFAVAWLVHLDRVMTFYGDTPWSFSSVKAAYYVGIIKEVVTREKFKF